MIVDQLIKQPGSWLSMTQGTGIVISSRVRLARNVRNIAFPEWAGPEECVRLRSDLHGILSRIPALADSMFLEMESLDPVEKDVLKERHLISNELADKGKGSGVLITKDESVAIMVNEEDHLRLQVISPGMQLPAIWEKIDAIDSEIEKHVEYAFSEQLGYLTACPSNVGTGLRASVMMHLPGLKLMGEIDPAIKGMNRIGLAVRGLLGEGTEAYGDMFQVSNQSSLGEKEASIIENLVKLVHEVAKHEQNARARLLEQRKSSLFDQLGRAYGILMHAQILSSREAIDLMSILKLGVDLGIVHNLATSRINEIILLSQPGHLQRYAAKILSPQERDETRARIVRQKLGNISIQEHVFA